MDLEGQNAIASGDVDGDCLKTGVISLAPQPYSGSRPNS
jgi:hypothetical protein